MFPFLEDELSVASYSLHKTLGDGMIDIYGYLESLRFRFNLRTADIWNGFLRDMDAEDFKKVRRAMDERGLTLANLCVDGAHPWADNAEDRVKQNDVAKKMLECAEILGARSVRIDMGVREQGTITEEQLECVSDAFRLYAQRGADCGFRFGPENHWGASRTLAVQKRVCAAVNHPNYGILLHLGNWDLEEGETSDGNDLAVAALAFHTHIDYRHSLYADECLPALRKAGYPGVWSVEHHMEVNEYLATAAQLGRVVFAASIARQGSADSPGTL